MTASRSCDVLVLLANPVAWPSRLAVKGSLEALLRGPFFYAGKT